MPKHKPSRSTASTTRRAALLTVALTSTGCYGAGTDVTAPGAKVPVSLSRSVRDKDGHIVRLRDQKRVGEFAFDTTVWSLAWGEADLHDTTDISEAINEQVAQVKGDAVTNLSITGAACGWGMVFGLNLLPFWPGCSSIEVRGDIVRVERGPARKANR